MTLVAGALAGKKRYLVESSLSEIVTLFPEFKPESVLITESAYIIYALANSSMLSAPSHRHLNGK